MDKQVYASPDGAPAVGPYSPAVGIGDFVFVSGQIPLDPDGKIAGYTPKDQARKALENLKATLTAAGLTLDDVVKTTIFIKDMDEFGAINDVYAEFFSEPYPARSTVEVARLPKDLHVEIEAIAYRG
ncbi:MAG TPA: Rid family detoxifying hydrolase [Thermoleophilia bacterium]|nr:Rid family detoxifying hydrolase [Thermoleophilia bacterium]